MINKLTKVSDINANEIANYIGLPDVSNEELNELDTYLNISKEYIKSYTGQEDLDKYQDFVIVVLTLCQDMYDTKTLYVDGNKSANKLVECILNLHAINLL